jgi:D-serine deaminase-like pyridoxal phosphate-dependent protein
VTAPAAQVERGAQLADLARDTPEIIVDLDTVTANIERAASVARQANIALRPHTKTHKLPQLAKAQVEAGAVGIQVAKLGEAEVMVNAGIQDVLVGYPIVGDVKLARLVALAQRAHISTTVDSFEGAAGISRVANLAGVDIDVLIEVDTGMHRLGVAPGRPAVELAERVAELPALRLAGVFTHEGHVYSAHGGFEEKERLTRQACSLAVESAEEIRATGVPADVVSVGSAGTFRFAVRCPGVTEVRPGTYIYNDRSQIAQGAATIADVAAFVVATVVSRPAADRVVVDVGSKVMSSDRMIVADPPASFGAVVGHDDFDLVRLSEEHGIIEVPPDAEVRVGDRIVLIPNHICTVMNLANEITIVQKGAVVEYLPIVARGLVQ